LVPILNPFLLTTAGHSSFSKFHECYILRCIPRCGINASSEGILCYHKLMSHL
jgi:hypothetical protein